jgi:hypothetical protein
MLYRKPLCVSPLRWQTTSKCAIRSFCRLNFGVMPAGLTGHSGNSRTSYRPSTRAGLSAASCSGTYKTLCALRATPHWLPGRIGHNLVVTRLSKTTLKGAFVNRLSSSLMYSLRNWLPHRTPLTAKLWSTPFGSYSAGSGQKVVKKHLKITKIDLDKKPLGRFTSGLHHKLRKNILRRTVKTASL